MMNGYTKRIVFDWMSALAALSVGCGEAAVEEFVPREPAGGSVTVRIAAAQDMTRTEIEENGTVTRWSGDDRIALWASDGSTLALEAEPFALWHFGEEYPEAWFTATIAPMTGGRYTYYGAYPQPAAVSGTVAEYDLPSVQTGSTDLRHAVMVARPAEGGALTDAAAEELRLSFVHKLHILKITIPEGRNLLEAPVRRLELDFARPVTGRLSVDVADPEAPVVLTGGSSVLTLDFPTPVEAGSTVFAVIAPVDLVDGAVSFRAYADACESESITMPGKNFLAGHTTPIRLTIPPMRPMTYLEFSVGQGEQNRLGEEPRSFVVRMLDGGSFPGGETELEFTADAGNRYEYSFAGEFADNLSGKRFEVVFDSDHAVVRNEFRMPAVQPFARNTVPVLEVPYLFFEDFSTVQEFGVSDWKDNSSNAKGAASELNYGFACSGWTGSQVFSTAGTSVTLKNRHEGTRIANGDYCGRLDSAPMTSGEGYGLKPDAPANVKIVFDYGCALNGTADSNYQVYMTYGSTTETGAVKAYYTQAGVGYNSRVSGTEQQIAVGENGSVTYRIDACTSAHRLSWDISCTGNSGWTPRFCNYYLTLDNIRVSIEK